MRPRSKRRSRQLTLQEAARRFCGQPTRTELQPGEAGGREGGKEPALSPAPAMCSKISQLIFDHLLQIGTVLARSRAESGWWFPAVPTALLITPTPRDRRLAAQAPAHTRPGKAPAGQRPSS